MSRVSQVSLCHKCHCVTSVIVSQVSLCHKCHCVNVVVAVDNSTNKEACLEMKSSETKLRDASKPRSC